ncbi:MAG: hypothetical protein ACLFP2_00850 [Candidatus Woesearchaeota archaeon]
MPEIHKQFQDTFTLFEKEHLAVRDKVNEMDFHDKELEKKLAEYIPKIDEWWFSYLEELATISSEFSEEENRTHKKFTFNSKLREVLQEGHFYWRIINKPRGYAGDAEMMNLIYRDSFEGSTPFGKLIHKHATEKITCEAVRNRRRLLRDLLLETEGDVLNLAAGPAAEIHDVLNLNGYEKNYNFLALDHDIKTLKNAKALNHKNNLKYSLGNAFQILKGDMRIAEPRGVLVDYCNPKTDFKGIQKLLAPIKYKTKRLAPESYDFVYTAGLYDYIQTYPNNKNKGTVALTRNLFELVKPGGSLVIGNFSYNNPDEISFSMEYLQDWVLIYRNEEEIRYFASSIDEEKIANIDVLAEPTNINYFLKIEKK